MVINRSSFLPLIVISSLLAGNEWLPAIDVRQNVHAVHVCANTSQSTSMIIAQASSDFNTSKSISLYGSYTEEEVDLMAVICYREARGEGIEGMQLVADVILNRVDSDKFPDQNSIKEVISYPGAFSTYREGDMEEPEITIDCYGAVLAELQERTDSEILYFTSGGYSSYGEPAYKFKNHYFSK